MYIIFVYTPGFLLVALHCNVLHSPSVYMHIHVKKGMTFILSQRLLLTGSAHHIHPSTATPQSVEVDADSQDNP